MKVGSQFEFQFVKLILIRTKNVDRRNNKLSCKDPKAVPTVIHTKFSSTAMILAVVSNESDGISPHFFLRNLRIDAAD